ncbi:GNAT family N-acetyltransferase [Ekhidna sp.]|uniref:GNAT family N-acetyltransferase n=1 Tax=Ekhidna sp. TaxID=2608089 RepID=UPI0032995788
MFYENGKLMGLLPANIDGKIIYSHQGLTYGGLILSKSIKLGLVIEMFNSLVDYLKSIKLTSLFYKSIPGFYHQIPSFEDEYCLFLQNAQLIRRDTGFVTDMTRDIRLQSRRKRAIKKASKEGIFIEKADFTDYWKKILIPNLKSRFGVTPVHSLDEINHLASKFPDNIVQYNALKDGEIVAGTTLFISEEVVHAQYISGKEYGRELGAVDYLFHHLITEVFKDKKYFSFGIANEKNGRFLNTGLADWKEGFDSNAWVHNFYQLSVK